MIAREGAVHCTSTIVGNVRTSSTPQNSKSRHRIRSYSSLTRSLHTAQPGSAPVNKHHQGKGNNIRSTILSAAPIQRPTHTKITDGPPAIQAQIGLWSLMTANTSNWPGAQALITALGMPSNPSRPTFITIQEHRNAGPEDCKRAEDWARNQGYNLSFAPAASTGSSKLHTSGGVAVGALKHIGITKDLAFQQHFAKHTGRIHAVICNCLFSRGTLLVGMYWKNGLDMVMLRKLAKYLLVCGRPWILAGDWNVPPAVLTRTGFLTKTGGRLIAQQRNTCEMGRGSNIDYVVLSDQMAAKYSSDYLWDAGPIAPHHPYFVSFTSAMEQPVYKHRTKPKSFLVQAPIGCQRAPLRFTWAQAIDAPIQDVAAAWKEWVTNVEIALCHRFDLDLRGESERYKGRSKGLNLTWRTLRDKPGPRHSRISTATLKWRSIKALARQADNILAAAEELHTCADCSSQLERITEHRTCLLCKASTRGCQTCRTCGWTQCQTCLQAQDYALPSIPRKLSATAQQAIATCLRQIVATQLQLPDELGSATNKLADKIYEATPTQRQDILQNITIHSDKSSKNDKKQPRQRGNSRPAP